MTTAFEDLKYGDNLFLTPKLPQGLAAAVEGLTREVLRHRPENIYLFAANHFEKLLHLREQYDGDKQESNQNRKLLCDINDAIKERHVYRESMGINGVIQKSAWSMNETAKVLERHRSIFGDIGQKISTDEVRELAKEPILKSSKLQESKPVKINEKLINGKHMNKYTALNLSKKKASSSALSSNQLGLFKIDFRNTPKIISQIPLTKDIKNELKRNRISSKERRNVDDKKMQAVFDRTGKARIESNFQRSIEKTKRSHEIRSVQRNLLMDDSMKKKINTIRSRVDSPRRINLTRSLSMDRVKNYVIQNFIGMKSLDELQTPSYVEKVHEVIEETSTIIKEKVEALKADVVKSTQCKQSLKDNVFSSDDYSKSSRKSVDSCAKNQEINSCESSLSSKSLLYNENAEQLEIKMSNKSDSSNDSNISLPAVRPTSSKSNSRSLSARSEFDGLILPPISPESTKSQKVKEELVLPFLSPCSIAGTCDFSDLENSTENVVQNVQISNDEEIYQDNVTPILTEEYRKQISHKMTEVLDKNGNSNLDGSLETLKDKLLEIEQVQKRIEDVLADKKITEDIKLSNDSIDEKSVIVSKIEDKLLEVQESEMRIEKILESQSRFDRDSKTTNTDMKSKLQELENAERRIETILINDIKGNSSNQSNTTEMKTDQNDKCSSDNDLSHIIQNNNACNREEKLERKINVNTEINVNDSSERNISLSTEIDRALSPNSYILTEGSPYEIPDFVTTVIIPDRIPTPDYDALKVDLKYNKLCSTTDPFKEAIAIQIESNTNELQDVQKISINDAFGEIVNSSNIEISTVDAVYIHGIKINHDQIISRQDLCLIEEECVKEMSDSDIVDSEDEKVLKVVTSSLEEILEKGELEYVSNEEVHRTGKKERKDEEVKSFSDIIHVTEYDSTAETKETSITDEFIANTKIVEKSLDFEEIPRSAESTNEIKQTKDTIDKSSLTFNNAEPIVPELNLDSLPDLTISSFNITDDEQKVKNNKEQSKDSNSSEILISLESCNETLNGDSKSAVKYEALNTDYEETELGITTVSEIRQDDENISNRITTQELPQKSKDTLMELENEYQEVYKEQLETEEYEKLEQSLKTGNTEMSEVIINEHKIDSKNIQEDIDKQINIQDDLPITIFLHSESLLLKDNNIVSDFVKSSVINLIDTNKEPSHLSMNEENLLTPEINNSDSKSKVYNDSSSAIKDIYLEVIDYDQNNQFIDTSEASSECMALRQLDSKDISTGVLDEYTHPLICAPESITSEDIGSPTDTNTIMSAVTKIQAGVRGFLARRRLQSIHRGSSTLDSVPSIQETLQVEELDSLKASGPPSAASLDREHQACIRKLRREDALQRTTLSVENAFAEGRLQHTSEFQDCLPLPVFDLRPAAPCADRREPPPPASRRRSRDEDEPAARLRGTPGLLPAAALGLGRFVDALQSGYLNFITSVEDAHLAAERGLGDSPPPGTPRGVVIEEIASLEEGEAGAAATPGGSGEAAGQGGAERVGAITPSSSSPPPPGPAGLGSLADFSIPDSEGPLSLNVDELLGVGDEGAGTGCRLGRASGPPTGRPDVGTRDSREGRPSEARARSPVTATQVAATSVEGVGSGSGGDGDGLPLASDALAGVDEGKETDREGRS